MDQQPKKPNNNFRPPAQGDRPRPAAGQTSDNRPPQRGPRSTSRGAAGQASAGRGGNGQRSNNRQNGGASRGEAIRAQKRAMESANRIAGEHLDSAMRAQIGERREDRKANVIVDETNKIKITMLGGLADVGEKNMFVLEYQGDAIIVDCGNDLSVDLPGVNYAINDPAYLETIKHKIRGYVLSHGHLDHIGGLRHIVPRYPAPIFGSSYTIGVVEKTFEDAATETGLQFKPQLNVMNMDNHERLKLGNFVIELVRITHSIPECATVVIDTPAGRIIHSGDFRLDPEPLDQRPSDIERLKKLGNEGVLLLLSESTNVEQYGRTPTEHTLQDSFYDLIGKAQGRVFIAIFSSNMNRIQMIVNAAVKYGRRVALDGRSMMSYAEIAVKQGILKIPKGTVLPMREMPNIPDTQVLVVCTGGQGEPGAALQRMSLGEHKHIKLKDGDTVVISSSPIPGNEVSYDAISNNLSERGVHLYRHITYELDGVGPLHVSGHGRRDEMREMLQYLRPKFFMPFHAGALRRRYHADIAVEEGWPRANVLLPKNGDVMLLSQEKWEPAGEIAHGSWLVDQTGNVVSSVVVKDRVMLAEQGVVVVILTVDKKTGTLLTSPDIVTRGFIYIRDNEELMNEFRIELRRAVQQRFKRIDIDRFKAEIKDHVTHFLYEKTQRSPIVIPVVNVINGKGERPPMNDSVSSQTKTEEEIKAEQQKRFQEMRARLLGSDQSD